jgi:Putative zinc-finger
MTGWFLLDRPPSRPDQTGRFSHHPVSRKLGNGRPENWVVTRMDGNITTWLTPWRRQPDRMTCRAASRELQAYLDGETDLIIARRVRSHLKACRRCGLEASTYRAIKKALARRAPDVDRQAVERLRAFGAAIAGAGGEPPA